MAKKKAATKKAAKKKAKRKKPKEKDWKGTMEVRMNVEIDGIPAANERQAEQRLERAVEYIVNAMRCPKHVFYDKKMKLSVKGSQLYMCQTDVYVQPDGWGVECEDDD
jgi:predicted SprT family Zn-dependent metalloprotease